VCVCARAGAGVCERESVRCDQIAKLIPLNSTSDAHNYLYKTPSYVCSSDYTKYKFLGDKYCGMCCGVETDRLGWAYRGKTDTNWWLWEIAVCPCGTGRLEGGQRFVK
jgi:hypothetical protein